MTYTACISDQFTKDGKFYDTIEVRNENGGILGSETIIRTWDLLQYEITAAILAGGYSPRWETHLN